MKIIPDWEKIAEDTYRLRVFGGWLIKVDDNHSHFTSLVFVPDIQGVWKI